jgi:prepilin-type N-terminal cleavage/methylation domain-containing protein
MVMRKRAAFTLVELLVVIGIIALLVAILMPSLTRAREQANKIKCMANLRELGIAMSYYANNEHDHGYPRVTFRNDQHLQLDNAGYLLDEKNQFGGSGYVGDNNVPSAFFLLFRSQKINPWLMVCPSTGNTPGFLYEDRTTSCNWQDISRGDISYSMATPYPTAAAEKDGFIWKVNRLPPQFVLIADINPGTRGMGVIPNNVLGPLHTASDSEMRAANSNNHRNKGQNVLYSDLHVEFSTTPYCGAQHRNGFRDNIYTAGATEPGTCDDKSQPVDKYDSVLLPTDDPGGK